MISFTRFAGLQALSLSLVFLASSASSTAAVIEGCRTQIIFSEETGGILGIVNTTTGHNFVSAPSAKPKLWRIVLNGKDGKRLELSNIECAKPAIIPSRDSVALTWKSVAAKGANGSFDVLVNCRILAVDRLAHFRISVENNSDVSMVSAVFPEISGLGTSGKSDIAYPKYNWGEMFKGLNHAIGGRYPAADTPMQFCAMTDGNDSIYLASHDPGAMAKNFTIHPGVVYSTETAVPNSSMAGNAWRSPFDFVLGAYQGDWLASCKLYRNWAIHNAPWMARGPISKRKDVSSVVKEISGWLNLNGQFTENGKAAMEFRKQIGVPIGVHWYSWHNNAFDRDYPDYLPPKPGFVDMVKKLKEAGIYSMPYMNGRLWDTQNRSYQIAKPYVSSDLKGIPNLEDYHSGTKLAVMCLGHPFWQNYLSQTICQIANETESPGIYIDQLGGAEITECYNTSHGHTLGKDRWWIDGYRKSITDARNRCSRNPGGFFVATENNAEPYMDFVDLFLVWIPRSENDIPMMTAVYGGYTQYFGTNRASDSDMSFAMLQARDFTWGAQLFWESAYILDSKHKEKMKILSNLAKLRYKARKYLVEGELIGLVKPLNSIPTVSGKWGSWGPSPENRTLPAVQAALWKADDGTYAVVLANADAKDQTFEFEFTPTTDSSNKWTVQKITQAQSEHFGVVSKEKSRRMINVPGRDGAVLTFQ